MNWPGAVLGLSCALILVGGLGAAFLPRARHAVLALSGAQLGAAGVCLAFGSGWTFRVLGILLAGLVPAICLAAVRLAPVAEPDLRRGRRRSAAAGAVAVFLLLSWTLVRTPWPAAVGERRQGPEWLGARWLSEDLVVLAVLMGSLALAGAAAVTLLRPRRERQR